MLTKLLKHFSAKERKRRQLLKLAVYCDIQADMWPGHPWRLAEAYRAQAEQYRKMAE